MALGAKIFMANVMHKRLFPKINSFNYGVYYLAVPLSDLAGMSDGWRFGVNRKGVLSFYDIDYGAKDGSSLEHWMRSILHQYGFSQADGEILLVTMPRVFGYVFNPISLWFCFDKVQQLRAVLCEVNNTFGETHCYLCGHEDQRIIATDDWLEAEKLFHVSPFLKREGYYRFRFSYEQTSLGVWIDYYNADKEKQLITALTGSLVPYTRRTRGKAFWRHPLVTLKTISLIHWQAIKLVTKRIKYICKPLQKEKTISATENLTKM